MGQAPNEAITCWWKEWQARSCSGGKGSRWLSRCGLGQPSPTRGHGFDKVGRTRDGEGARVGGRESVLGQGIWVSVCVLGWAREWEGKVQSTLGPRWRARAREGKGKEGMVHGGEDTGWGR
ncbi:hypothetical protein PIB30_098015 [Stylosanthes scabra]|uniref:Uncharacterized protein n=1 Tax=Stylosanthes scabra TaxID=79078 RepID=A0ABU6XVN4_9FABA|nr:hypothetical protein [Stylosanthes scabra]